MDLETYDCSVCGAEDLEPADMALIGDRVCTECWSGWFGDEAKEAN